MPCFVILNSANRKPLSYTEALPPNLGQGLEPKSITQQPDATHVWDPATETVIEIAPAVDQDLVDAQALVAKPKWSQLDRDDAARLNLKKNYG